MLELEGTAGPVSSRMHKLEAGAPPGKRMRRIRSDPSRIRFTGLDGPVGPRMPAQQAVHASSPDPRWVHADSKKRNHILACISACPTLKESSTPPAAASESARQHAPRRHGASVGCRPSATPTGRHRPPQLAQVSGSMLRGASVGCRPSCKRQAARGKPKCF